MQLRCVLALYSLDENPDDLSVAVKYYVDMLKNIHSIEVEDGEVPDIKESALMWADFVAEHIPEDQGKKLRALIQAVPKKNTLMHGDYHTNNIMIQNGEPLLIDMDTLCMGHPVFEFAGMFNAYVAFAEHDHQNIMDFFGYPRLQCIVEAGAGKSSVTALQRLGRIMRPFEGKHNCTFITYRDTAPFICQHIDKKLSIWRTEEEFMIYE